MLEGNMDTAVPNVLEKRRPEGIADTIFLDRQVMVIRRRLDILNLEPSALARDGPFGIVEVTPGVALA